MDGLKKSALLLLCCLSSWVASWPSPVHASKTDLRPLLQTGFGLHLDETEATFSDDELDQVYSLLKTGALSAFPKIDAVSTLSKKKNTGELYLEYGDYDEKSRTISIVDQSPHFAATFIHEYFHALSVQFPKAFADFETLTGWSVHQNGDEIVDTFQIVDPASGKPLRFDFSDYELAEEADSVIAKLDFPIFPSDYSKLGPDEMFAECGAATSLSLEGQGRDLYRLDTFVGTNVYQWMQGFIKTGAGGYNPGQTRFSAPTFRSQTSR